MLYKVTRPIPQRRTAPPSQICEDQFSRLTFLYRLTCLWIKDFSDELTFIDVYPLLLRTGKAISPHFRHACVVKGMCSPCPFDAFASGRNRGPWLPSMNGHPHT